MRTLLIAFGLGFVFALTSLGDVGLSVAPSAQAQVRPQPNTPEWHALWRKCRTAVVLKYGYRVPDLPKKIVLPDGIDQKTDACMANGGRVS